MSTALKKTGEAGPAPDKRFRKLRIGIAVASWNPEITHAMRDGAIEFLTRSGVEVNNIEVHDVPGSFELPLAAQFLAANKKTDAVIAIGCVIQGETRHFDFICQACADGIIQVSLKYNKPVAFGVLTTQTLEQAKERAGGSLGNKGEEAAGSVLQMLQMQLAVN